ncbi:hypothetical protein D3C72_1492980 [compost metagenome]
MAGGRHGIVAPRNDQGRRRDQRDGAPQVRIAHGRERACQAVLVGGHQPGAEPVDDGAAGLQHAGREPVAQEHLGGLRHVRRLQRRGDARVPLRRGPQIGGRVGQDQPVDAVRRVHAQPLPNEAAQRQAQEMDARDVQAVQQFNDVAAQPVHRIGARRHAGRAVAAGVVAQHAEVPRQRRDLPVPHMQRRADGVGQDQHRQAGVAVDAVGDAQAVAGSEERKVLHGGSACSSGNETKRSCAPTQKKLQSQDHHCQKNRQRRRA